MGSPRHPASLNQTKISEDAKWDGFYAVEASDLSLDAEEIIGAYHDLWKIEESFRALKTHLETRPMFHWKPKRITGHLVWSFIALVMEREIELTLKNCGEKEVTHRNIREAIATMETAQLTFNESKFTIDNQMNHLDQLPKTEPT